MNLEPIPRVKARLITMYPMFRFDVKANARTDSYHVSVFSDVVNLSTLIIESNTPIDVFWERIKTWMRPFVATYQ